MFSQNIVPDNMIILISQQQKNQLAMFSVSSHLKYLRILRTTGVFVLPQAKVNFIRKKGNAASILKSNVIF